MRYAAFVLIILLTRPACAQEQGSDLVEKYRKIAIEAIVVSRIADRLCPNLTLDVSRENIVLDRLDLKSWSEAPRVIVRKYLVGFEQSNHRACEFAWRMYGSGTGGPVHPSLRLLSLRLIQLITEDQY
ncbi:hypothetical protein [Methylobacterium crusticola]|uniref:hypothetical protein n=1 Tax=Methylobacterium crusticola TaxID=1697972 RepID=UPI000FFB0D1D|nr:hypothetical protein [Methylobacterium crusticola]